MTHDRLFGLAKRIAAIPVPSDTSSGMAMQVLKVTAATLFGVASLEPGDDGVKKDDILAQARKAIGICESTLGADNEPIRIFKAMYAIAVAVAEGKQEPTDEELGIEAL